MRCRLVILVAVASVVAASRPANALPPVTVSPGALDGFAGVGWSCPTFSWADDAAAVLGYELAVQRLEEAGDQPLLSVHLPAGARAWTPPPELCLRPAGRFSWAVRAVGAEGPGEWSAPRRFEVQGAVGSLELARALEVVRRHLGEEDSAPSGPAAAAEGVATRQPPAARPGGSPAGAAPGTGFGVDVGATGIGLLAVNLSPGGGADLVLDGGFQGRVDARITQSAIDRPSPLAQTFEIGNSAGGGLTLKVDGHAVVTTATDRDTLAELDCADGEIARFNAVQALWECAPPP